MTIFTLFWPTRFIFAAGVVEKSGEEARKIGKKAMVVTGKRSMKESGILDRVAENLREAQVEMVLYDRIEPNPRAGTIDEGGRLVRKEGCDFVIGLGGGSAMDAAKGIALAATHEGSIWDYIGSFVKHKDPTDTTLPLMAIPTVAATGSEGNGTAVITSEKTHEKSWIKSMFLFPRVAIIDPELTISVPPRMTAEGGVDIVCHVLEPYLTAQTPFEASDRVTEAIIRIVVDNLGRAVEDGKDLEARSNLSWASTLACSPFRGLGLSGNTTLHSMEHAVSGWFDVSHGAGLCALLPAWMDYISEQFSERFSQFAREIFGMEDAIKAMKGWLRKVGTDITLTELGVDRKMCRKMAEDTIRVYGKGEEFIMCPPRKLFLEDIVTIYDRAF